MKKLVYHHSFKFSNSIVFLIFLSFLFFGCSKGNTTGKGTKDNIQIASRQNIKTERGDVGQKPVLGWSSWSFLRDDPTAAKMKAQALALHKSGLQKLGYKYVNLDDFWYQCPDGGQGPNVDQYGRWVTDSKRFPAHGETNGIKTVADYVHGLGLKFGIYITPGISKQAVKKNTPIKGTSYAAGQIAESSIPEINYNCGGMVGIDFDKPGAQAYINSWADMFAKWGVDYIKIDGNTDGDIPSIKAWSKAIKQSGRPMILDITDAFTVAIAPTLMKYADQFETVEDVECYSCEKGGSSYPLTSWRDIAYRFDYVALWQPYAGPGHWPDYDSIEIGNGRNDGLTPAESEAQLSLWALASAPLILGVDLTHLNQQQVHKYLMNTAVLAVDQDGVAAKRYLDDDKGGIQVFAKMESNGDAIVGLFNNTKRKNAKISIRATAIGLPKNKQGYSLIDLWTGKKKKTDGSISAKVPSHGVVLYRVKVL